MATVPDNRRLEKINRFQIESQSYWNSNLDLPTRLGKEISGVYLYYISYSFVKGGLFCHVAAFEVGVSFFQIEISQLSITMRYKAHQWCDISLTLACCGISYPWSTSTACHNLSFVLRTGHLVTLVTLHSNTLRISHIWCWYGGMRDVVILTPDSCATKCGSQ